MTFRMRWGEAFRNPEEFPFSWERQGRTSRDPAGGEGKGSRSCRILPTRKTVPIRGAVPRSAKGEGDLMPGTGAIAPETGRAEVCSENEFLLLKSCIMEETMQSGGAGGAEARRRGLKAGRGNGAGPGGRSGKRGPRRRCLRQKGAIPEGYAWQNDGFHRAM